MNLNKKTLVLASSSPRRQALLRQIGLEFIVDPAEYAESKDMAIEPNRLAEKLSLEKARAVAPRHHHAVILAADTLGVLDGKIFGKPATADEARSLLKMLSGRTHLVHRCLPRQHLRQRQRRSLPL